MALSYPNASAEVMEHLCEHSAHGYSQPNRQGVGTGASVFENITLSDGTKVKIAQGDRDCSSASIEVYAALGVDVGGATYTGNMRKRMTGTGNFKWITDLSQRRRGDILLNESHHAAVYLGGGKLGQFSISERGTTHGTRGDQTGYESNIKSYYNYPWDGILRYCGPARKGSSAPSEPTKQEPSQDWSKAYGDPDWWGPKFTRAMQTQRGTTVDDIVSAQPKSNKKYCANCEASSWRFVDDYDGGSDMVKSLQKLTGATVDGWAGPNFWKSYQKWLKKHGLYDGEIDGSAGPKTCSGTAKGLYKGVFKK